MLSACIFLLVLLGCESQSAALHNSDQQVYFTDRLANVIEKKCLTTADKTKTNAALEGLQRFVRSFMVALPKENLNPEDFYNSCLQNTQNLTTHLDAFTETLKPCLKPQERYLTDFILDSYGNYNHHLCTYLDAADRGRDTCCGMFKQNPEINPLITCYKDSKIFATNSKVNLITKAELCNDLSHIRTCYEKLLDDHCPDSQEFRSLRLIVLKQGLEKCSDQNNA